MLCSLCEVKVSSAAAASFFYENRFFINFESHSEYKKILNKQCCLFSFLTVSKKLRFVVLVFAIWDAIKRSLIRRKVFKHKICNRAERKLAKTVDGSVR